MASDKKDIKYLTAAKIVKRPKKYCRFKKAESNTSITKSLISS